MKKPTTSLPKVEVVNCASQTELQRLAMMMMQLDMALAMARENGLVEVQTTLETALSEVRAARDRLLQ
ncbi:MAG: hypothetical protein CML29_00785 [Rhizobiales bacterium]|nr:hypothetical protein [Hyphomicrobiales bacterium]|tara:strand:- start:285 stop:488 length:204 start_codon:yes stop_codon:yes gene_type:complete